MNEYMSTPLGRVLTVLVLAVVLFFAGKSIKSTFGPGDAVTDAENPIFVNADTGYVFHCRIKAGMSYPVPCPDTGKSTGYEAELCYWTKDGNVKTEPTAVLLNRDKGLPEPTFCPDCGRLVVYHNPIAKPGHRPPPTQAEYLARRQVSSYGN